MSSLATLIATTLLASSVLAQEMEPFYTVWSSVIFQRTGERTPIVIGDIPTQLTSIGANQSFTAGSFFRKRYINAASNRTPTRGFGTQGAPLYGLKANIYDRTQVWAGALDQQWNTATAYAFLQGLYPPFSPGSNTSRSSASQFDNINVLANNTYVEAPLNGYQYPDVHTYGATDPNFAYLSAQYQCPGFTAAAEEYMTTAQFSLTTSQFNGTYDAIGSSVLLGVLDPEYWQYTNAYQIYDYLSYEYAYNGTVKTALDREVDVASNTSYLSILQWLADEQQFGLLGNVSAYNPVTKEETIDGVSPGSISTLPGNMFAYKVLDLFTAALESGAEENKLNLMVADYHPLVSFFSLMGLPELDAYFYGLPGFGSSVVFELFSWENATSGGPMPTNEDDLWVRFMFRNGSDPNALFQSYPLFNNGPSQTDMTWNEFRDGMSNIAVGDVGQWCNQCGGQEVFFCAAFDTDDSSGDSSSSGSGKASHRGLSPAVGGVIGAIIALVAAGMIFAAVVLFGGIRFYRQERRNSNSNSNSKGDLAGFRGGQRMRSDQDLTIPKGGAVAVGASIEESPTSPHGGHERVGSWELKKTEAGQGLGGHDGRDSVEVEEGLDHVLGRKATEPEERI